MKYAIDFVNENWMIILPSFLVLRVMELIINFIIRHLLRVVAMPFGFLKKVKLFDWTLIIVLIALLTYMIVTKGQG